MAPQSNMFRTCFLRRLISQGNHRRCPEKDDDTVTISLAPRMLRWTFLLPNITSHEKIRLYEWCFHELCNPLSKETMPPTRRNGRIRRLTKRRSLLSLALSWSAKTQKLNGQGPKLRQQTTGPFSRPCSPRRPSCLVPTSTLLAGTSR